MSKHPSGWDRERSSQRILIPCFRLVRRISVQFFVLSYSRSLFLFCDSKLIRPSLYILTRYVQSFGVLALPDVVVNLALHYRIVKISGRVVDDHFRGVVADHLLLINEPPKERGKEKKKND